MANLSLRAAQCGGALLALALLAGCNRTQNNADGNQLAFNDYEQMMGWVPNVETITREQAHSGKYSVKVDGAHEFGQGYSMELGKLIDHKPHKLLIQAWGYMTDANSNARLGFQLMDPSQNKEVFGDGIDYASAVKTPGKWVELSKEITLPAAVTGTNQIKVFLWRAQATSPAYIDDVRISEVQ